MREDVWLQATFDALETCTEKQRTVYMLHMGLTPSGPTRNPIGFSAISRMIGIKKQSVREYFLVVDAKVSKALFRTALNMLQTTAA